MITESGCIFDKLIIKVKNKPFIKVKIIIQLIIVYMYVLGFKYIFIIYGNIYSIT